MAVQISVVIPALNEEKSIVVCVEKALAGIRALGLEGEVVVADNGSTDRTVSVARAAGARVEPVTKKGYGSACMGGLSAARGEYLILGDADDSYNFAEIAPFVEKLKSGSDFVIGNRFSGKIAEGAMPPLHRYLGTPVLAFIMNLLFRTGTGDPNCGMRALTKKAFVKMRLRAAGMEFATEMVVKATRVRLKISEVPCNLYKDKRGRKSHLNTWVDGWRHLRFMLLFSTTWTFIIPGLALAALGLGGMTALALRDVLQPDLWLPVLTQKHMLSALLLLVLGVQILGLGLAADAFTFSRHFDHGKRTMRFLNKSFRLERGLLGGMSLVAAGVLGYAYLLASYMGLLPSPGLLLRFDTAIFAAALSVTGVQLIFNSFLLGLFYLKVK